MERLLDDGTGNSYATLVLSNDGTVALVNDGTAVPPTGDLKILVDNVDLSADYEEVNTAGTGTSTFTINPRQTIVLTDTTNPMSSGANTILIVTPSNSMRQIVYCS